MLHARHCLSKLRLVAASASAALVASLLVMPSAAEASPDLDEALVLTPGVWESRAQPETWSLDLRDMSREEAEAAAEGLTQRIYGSRDGELQQPLTLRTDYDDDVVLGIHIAAVCTCGADFDVKIDGEHFHRFSWPGGSGTHYPNTLYYFTVPAGDRSVSFEVDGSQGPVVLGAQQQVVPDDYAIVYAASVDDLPADRDRVEIEEGGTTTPPEPPPPPEPNTQIEGFRGIWFTLGQFSEWGDKYSGGLGTYTMKHSPLAVYVPEVDKTFFTYGGTPRADSRDLLIMAAEYDHRRHQVTRPTIVDTKQGVSDPHDNASIALDGDGYVWIFVSGRSTGRDGFLYRSVEPYNVEEFELMLQKEMTYPQPRHVSGEGFFYNFTKYTAGRELYWATSADGMTWSEDQKLAGFGGHYQVTGEQDGTVITAFNYHPSGVDTRTNLYFAMTQDMGETWTTIEGTELQTPLDHRDNPALVIDYEEQGRLNFNKDVAFDADGNPIVLHLTANGAARNRPGPDSDPRTWHVTHWTGDEWVTHDITNSDHNYDSGSLYVDGDTWTVYAPTEIGPQEWGTGGEMAIWESTDQGETWTQRVQVTDGSVYNHTYARRPLDREDPFLALWADGDPGHVSSSQIYFGDSTGRHWQLPYDMPEDTATPFRQCLHADDRPTVVVGDQDSGVANRSAWGRCSINDVIEDDLDWREAGLFVAHVTDVTRHLVDNGIISSRERAGIIAAAGRNNAEN